MKLTHIQVAHFMGATHEEALKKIIMIKENNPYIGSAILKTLKKGICESEDFDKRYGTSITFAASDVINNCLKRSGYRKYLLYDWPKKILDSEKPPKKIQLPVPLRGLIKNEDKEEIRRYWEQNFTGYISDNWVKQYNPIFEP